MASLPPDGKMASAVPTTTTSTRTLTVVAGTITINLANGMQIFSVDRSTRVVGQGAGTASATSGGRVPFGDLVGVGDRVSISYHRMDENLAAAEVRVTARAKK